MSFTGVIQDAAEARQLFLELIDGDPAPSLDQLLLAIAAEEAPPVDVAAAIGMLDELAEGYRSEFPADETELVQLAGLSEYLFQDQGFRGNSEEYYDQRNSLLHEVLVRRLGIPISLSVVTIEVGRRLGMELVGIGFPGHFLVAGTTTPDLYLDPFRGGQILRREDCRELLHTLSAGNVEMKSAHLEPVTPLQVVARVLQNIKGNHLRQGELEHAIRAVERILFLFPEAHGLLRERGLMYLQLGAFSYAAADLCLYLDLASDPPDAETITVALQTARRKASLLV